MSFSTGQAPQELRLVRYLLGSLPDAEAESLDELSIADDEFAAQLIDVENDLVDAYVKGELSGETLDRFRSRYLSSPAGREKVAFAETFRSHQKSALRATTAPAHKPGLRAIALPHWVPPWALAAAALLVLAAGGDLLVENLRLRSQVNESRASHAALEERERQLQKQLDDQRAADAGTAKELARVRESLAQLEAHGAANPQGGKAGLLSFVLLAATRGVGDITTLTIPPGTEAVTLRLALEGADFPSYRAALKDPATDRIVWSGADLRATSKGDAKALPITLNANQLKPQTYTVEVTGVPARGAAESVGNYPFRVVIR